MNQSGGVAGNDDGDATSSSAAGTNATALSPTRRPPLHSSTRDEADSASLSAALLVAAGASTTAASATAALARRSRRRASMADEFLALHDEWTELSRVEEKLDSDRNGDDPHVDARFGPMEYVRDMLTREEDGPEWQNAKRSSREDAEPSNDGDEGAVGMSRERAAEENSGETPPPASRMSLEELSEVLFRPGMKYLGRIFIPGLRGSSRDAFDDDDDDDMGEFIVEGGRMHIAGFGGIMIGRTSDDAGGDGEVHLHRDSADNVSPNRALSVTEGRGLDSRVVDDMVNRVISRIEGRNSDDDLERAVEEEFRLNREIVNDILSIGTPSGTEGRDSDGVAHDVEFQRIRDIVNRALPNGTPLGTEGRDSDGVAHDVEFQRIRDIVNRLLSNRTSSGTEGRESDWVAQEGGHLDRNENAESSHEENARSSTDGMAYETEAHEMGGEVYELVVLERGEDALSNKFILASHSAYTDEQCVNIELKIKEGGANGGGSCDSTKRLEVQYADGETCCLGTWNPEKSRFEGHVRQRLQANDGIFHADDAVTHVFTLYPCTGGGSNGRSSPSSFEKDILSRDSRAVVAHRNRSHDALGKVLQTYLVLHQLFDLVPGDLQRLRLAFQRHTANGSDTDADPSFTEKQKLMWKLRNVRWTKMLDQLCRIGGERLCAEFRFRASLLDALQFETTQERLDVLERWKAARMDLAGAHACWESRQFFLHALIQMARAFGAGTDDAALGRPLGVFHRMGASFACLDGAWRRAEARLPTEELAKFELPSGEGRGLDGADCIICQLPLLDVDGDSRGASSRLYQLPCSHSFHEKCLRRWLHDHSSCPVCRYSLAENPNRTHQT